MVEIMKDLAIFILGGCTGIASICLIVVGKQK